MYRFSARVSAPDNVGEPRTDIRLKSIATVHSPGNLSVVPNFTAAATEITSVTGRVRVAKNRNRVGVGPGQKAGVRYGEVYAVFTAGMMSGSGILIVF